MEKQDISGLALSLGWVTYEQKDPPDCPVYTKDNSEKPGWFFQINEFVNGVWTLSHRRWDDHLDCNIHQMMLEEDLKQFILRLNRMELGVEL